MAQTPDSHESHESHEGGAGIVFEPTPGVDLRGEVLSLLAGLGASYEVHDDLGVVYVTTGNGGRWVCGLPRCLDHGSGLTALGAVKNAFVCI